MSFGDAIRTCFSKYVTFNGRASRSEYWWFMLFAFLVYVLAMILDSAINGYPAGAYLIVVLGLALPTISVAVRRLHDTGRSGWWYFIQLIPLVGPIVFLIWMCTGGVDGENNFGSHPLIA